MLLSVWTGELKKYKEIIDLVKHTLFQKEAGHEIRHLIKDIDTLIDQCQLTTLRISGTHTTPLVSASSMLSSNIDGKLINQSIAAAELFLQEQLQLVKQAASGKYTYICKDFNELNKINTEFISLGAKPAIDYISLGLTVHLFENDPILFDVLKKKLS